MSKYSEKLRTSCGCVIKSMEPKSAATIDDMRNVVSAVNSLEEDKMIAPWDEDKIPEEVVSEKPTPGYAPNCNYRFTDKQRPPTLNSLITFRYWFY